MLQQILRDMWVAPEILAELDETQKQTLFCKMREEQLRRWSVWDQKLSKQEELGIDLKPSMGKKNTQKKNVQFLLGENGEPWVWVMGEHENDKTIEEILEQETIEKARIQALKETEELRKSVERELGDLIGFTNEQMDSMEKDCILLKKLEKIEDIYCSVDELREKMKNMTSDLKSDEIINNSNSKSIEFSNNIQNKKQNNTNYKNNITNFNFIEGKREILQEINTNKEQKVSARVALWERKVTEQRTGEILRSLRHRQAQALREAEELAPAQQLLWEEQERKAKEAELQIRDIARRAREEYKRSSVIINEKNQDSNKDSPSLDSEICYMDPSLNVTESMKPPSRDAIIQWFIKTEKSRGAGLDEQGKTAKWFHGLITRNEAEALLENCSIGSYLVRVSERIWGYAISYKAADRCKHYLIDASQISHYQFLGANQVTHKSLANLVSYHNKNEITEIGKEILLSSCESTKMPLIMETVS